MPFGKVIKCRFVFYGVCSCFFYVFCCFVGLQKDNQTSFAKREQIYLKCQPDFICFLKCQPDFISFLKCQPDIICYLKCQPDIVCEVQRIFIVSPGVGVALGK